MVFFSQSRWTAWMFIGNLHAYWYSVGIESVNDHQQLLTIGVNMDLSFINHELREYGDC